MGFLDTILGRSKDQSKAHQLKDPICGMQTNPETAAASVEQGGQTYYFCSENCQEKFLAGNHPTHSHSKGHTCCG